MKDVQEKKWNFLLIQILKVYCLYSQEVTFYNFLKLCSSEIKCNIVALALYKKLET